MLINAIIVTVYCKHIIYLLSETSSFETVSKTGIESSGTES